MIILLLTAVENKNMFHNTYKHCKCNDGQIKNKINNVKAFILCDYCLYTHKISHSFLYSSLLLAYSVHLNCIFDYLFLVFKERLHRKSKDVLSMKAYLKTVQPTVNRSYYQFTFEALVC